MKPGRWVHRVLCTRRRAAQRHPVAHLRTASAASSGIAVKLTSPPAVNGVNGAWRSVLTGGSSAARVLTGGTSAVTICAAAAAAAMRAAFMLLDVGSRPSESYLMDLFGSTREHWRARLDVTSG